MSTESRCSYVHDISGDRFDDLSIDRWHCPYLADTGDHCPFHSDETTGSTRQLLERIEQSDPVHNRFFGATFGSIVLDYETLDGQTNHPIDLRETTIRGQVSCRNAVVSQSLLFDGATVEGDVTLDGTTFNGRVLFTDASINALECEEAVFRRRFDLGYAEIDSTCNCRLAAFESWVDFRETTFSGNAHFRNARFYKGIYGEGVVFERSADFVNATFDKVGNFKTATFGRGCNFAYTEFHKSASFRRAKFVDQIEFQASQTTGKVADHRAGFDGVGWFDHMSVGLDLRFHDVELGGEFRLQNVVVDGELTVDPDDTAVSTGNDQEVVVDLAKSTVTDGTLVCPAGGPWRYDLTDAKVGDIHITGEDVFERLQIRNTTFAGFDFSWDSHGRALANSNWTLHDDQTESQNPSVLENTYLKAKNGAVAGGATKVASEFFRKELFYRRKNHRKLAREAETYRETLRHAGRYLANWSLSTTTGYGERPSYVFAWSVGIVGGFAALYALLNDSTGLLESLLFSFQSFITFILGTPPVSNLAVQTLSSIQGFLGAFFIALFVFTLTRSVHR